MTLVTSERLRELLSYDPETGLFIRKLNRRSWKAGSIAGCLDSKGYRIITINNKPYKAHRLAWFYVYRVWPTLALDHKDCNKDNNRISNLREATDSQNHQNIHRAFVNSKSGVLGVMPYRRGRWRVSLFVGGKQVVNRSYSSKDEAISKFSEMKREHHPFGF